MLRTHHDCALIYSPGVSKVPHMPFCMDYPYIIQVFQRNTAVSHVCIDLFQIYEKIARQILAKIWLILFDVDIYCSLINGDTWMELELPD